MWDKESTMILWREVIDKFKQDFPVYSKMLKDNGYKIGTEEKKNSSFGWADRKQKRAVINTYLHKNSTREMVVDTMLHELAHCIDYCIRGRSSHDKEWKKIAAEIGATPLSRSKSAVGVEYPFVMVWKKDNGEMEMIRGFNRKPSRKNPGRIMYDTYLTKDKEGTLNKLWLYTWKQWSTICMEKGISLYKKTEED